MKGELAVLDQGCWFGDIGGCDLNGMGDAEDLEVEVGF